MGDQRNLFLQEQETKEEIKDAIYLFSGKHILDEHAEQILQSYKEYINNNYVSVFTYAVDFYNNKRNHIH